MRRAVFLDRDGTLIEDVDYLRRLDEMTLFPWTIDALRLLTRSGFATVVVTNQSAVARGLVTEEFVRDTHAALDARLRAGGARVDAYYYCPHHPEAAIEQYRRRCRCRKPAPGMIEDAASDLALNLPQSWIVGDRWLDIETGRNAGVRSILVGGEGAGPTRETARVDGDAGRRTRADRANRKSVV